MTAAARERLRIRLPLLFVSAAAWLVLLSKPEVATFVCSAEMSAPSMAPTSLHALYSPDTSTARVTAWALMLASMMLPLLTSPLHHVWSRSFARRRLRASALFICGYVAMWMTAGVVLMLFAFALRERPGVSFTVAAAAALVWQFSPLKQRCLNRCHAEPELAAFGFAADRDAFCFGLEHAAWCTGSCWALMSLPLVATRGHLALMAAVMLWVIAERLDPATSARWRWRGPRKALRMLVAQAQMRLARD